MLLAPFTSRCTRAPQPEHRKRRPRGEEGWMCPLTQLDVPAHTTGFRRIRFINPLHDHPQPRCLFAEIAGELPMRPLADLLIGSLAQADPGLDVTHIPHRDVGD